MASVSAVIAGESLGCYHSVDLMLEEGRSGQVCDHLKTKSIARSGATHSSVGMSCSDPTGGGWRAIENLAASAMAAKLLRSGKTVSPRELRFYSLTICRKSGGISAHCSRCDLAFGTRTFNCKPWPTAARSEAKTHATRNRSACRSCLSAHVGVA